MRRRYILVTLQTMSKSTVQLLRVLVIGIVLVGAVLAGWPLFADLMRRQPSALVKHYPNMSIRYEMSEDALAIWQICRSPRAHSCFIAGTTPTEAVIEGASLFRVLLRADMSASRAAHLAARVWGDDPSSITYESLRMQAHRDREAREIEPPVIQQGTLTYWTHANAPGPCEERKVDLASGDSSQTPFERCSLLDPSP